MDQAEFEDIYRDNWQALLGFALRRTSSVEDAADVVADVFCTAWRRRHEVPPRGAARLWLFGVARHVLANQRRGVARRGRLENRLAEAVHVLSPDPSVATEEREGVRAVQEALSELSEDDRELITLVAWDGLAPREAAVVLQLSPAVVRVRLHRARARLRVALEQRAGRPGHVVVSGQPSAAARECS